jgi:hypothetical protein
MDCEEIVRVIDMAVRLYEVLSAHGELGDIKSMMVPVVRSLFERAREVCR